MMSMAINSRWYRYLPWALLLAYAALALILHEERIMNTDCSLQFFSSVNKHGFFFQESRYGVLPTQVPLVLGILLGLPMKWLVIIYSMTFPLVYGAILLIEQRVLRSTEAALATIASLIIGQASTFLHCTTETHLLLAASGMLYATWQALGQCAIPGGPLVHDHPPERALHGRFRMCTRLDQQAHAIAFMPCRHRNSAHLYGGRHASGR
jgi:hypothetical protein